MVQLSLEIIVMSTNKICHIYLYPFRDNIDADTSSALKKRTSESRLIKSEKYVNQKDRIRSILGENLISYSIFKSFNLKFSSMNFYRNYYGKPFLKGRSDIHFSLSYTDGWIGCAVSTDPVGFDMEKIKEIDLSIAERFFTEDEYLYIKECNDDREQIRFFELWTLKESYIKAIGKGLSCPLNSFSIRKINDRIYMEKVLPDHPRMNFKMIPLGHNYQSALCYSPGLVPEDPFTVTTFELVKSQI